MIREKKRFLFYMDIFGNVLIFKRIIIFIFGLFSYNRYNGFNQLNIKGTENLNDLPNSGVLIVSNHQTYFADVFAMFHVIFSAKNGYVNSIQNPMYLLYPKLNLYYIAARETMRKGILAKIFAYSGAITIKRSWRSAGKNIQRNIDRKDPENIQKALNSGWVITFPQGTTTPFMPGRKGTAMIIKRNKPVVVPVVIDGFRRAYDKKGLIIKKKGVRKSITFKEPLKIDYENDSAEKIMEQIMDSIEQSPRFMKIKPIKKTNT